MTEAKTGFIGAGNMAGSLIGGMLRAGYRSDRIVAADPQPNPQTQSLGIEITMNNRDVALCSDVLVLAVKPQILKQVCKELSGYMQEIRPLIISIAAGIRIESIQRWLQHKSSIIRVMPNTPALTGQGMSALFANPECSDVQKTMAEQLMQSVGQTVWLEAEREIDTVTAISGSGPAYFFLFIESLIEAAICRGLPPDTARRLAVQTARGASSMLGPAGEGPAELRHRVTSPGGTTEQAIKVLLNGRLPELVREAVDAAARRSEQLSEESGE